MVEQSTNVIWLVNFAAITLTIITTHVMTALNSHLKATTLNLSMIFWYVFVVSPL